MLSSMKRAAVSTFRKAGFDIKRYNPRLQLWSLRADVLAEYAVDLVLDVGANEGQYGLEVRESGYKGRLVSFEPVEQAFRGLDLNAASDPLWECRSVALGEADGTSKINVGSQTYISSLLPLGTRVPDAAPGLSMVGEQEIKIERLDSLRDQLGLSGSRIYLKLDVQGYEKSVLDGAGVVLDDVVAVETELSLCELYEGQWLIHEAFPWFHTHGFSCITLDAGFADPKSGRLLQVDAIFVREGCAHP